MSMLLGRMSLFALGVTTALVAGSPAPAQDAKTLRVVMHAPLRITDPILTTAFIVQSHGYMIYDTLFATDANQTIQPQMVEKWEVSADRLTYTFTLRDGLRWHDGAPVTSEDCIASIRRWGQRDVMGQKLLAATGEMAAIDAKSFRIVLKQPYALVLEALGKTGTNVPFMMPKRVAETPPDREIGEQIGSGPFKFVKAEFQPGVKTVYEKNPDYVPRSEAPSWTAGAKLAKVERVEWINIGDTQTTTNALVRGEIDLIEMPAHDAITALEKSAGVVVRTHAVLGNTPIMRLNWLQPPFNNPKIRQAVLHALSQEEYLAVLAGDPKYWAICRSFFPCGTIYGVEDTAAQGPTANVERAKQLLRDGGYKGERIVILSPGDVPVLAPFGPIAAQALRRVGINVDLQSLSWANTLQRRANKGSVESGGWHVFQTYLNNGDIVDPVRHFGVGASGAGAWFGWPKDDEIEALREQFSREPDAAKRKALAAAIQKRAYETVVYVPLGKVMMPYAYRANLAGILDGPTTILWNIEKK